MGGKTAEKYSFIVVRYLNKEIAEAALGVLNGLAQEKVVKLKDAVALTKDEKGKVHMHQSRDDPAGRGFLKGGVIGIVFAVLFGAAGWIVAGAVLGTAFAMFERGIKNKLLQELGEHDRRPVRTGGAGGGSRLGGRQGAHGAQNFHGEVVVQELVEEHLAEVEKLAENAKAVEQVPAEVELKAEAEAAAPQAEESPAQ